MQALHGFTHSAAAEPGSMAMEEEEVEEMIGENESLIRIKAFIFAHVICVLASFFLLFSEIGFGASVFKGLIGGYAYSTAAAAVGFAVFVVMYVFDLNSSSNAERSKCCDQHAFLAVKNLLMMIVLASVLISAVLSFKTQPQAPLLTYVVVGSLYFTLIRLRFFGSMDVILFLNILSSMLVAAGVIGIAVSLIWSGINNFWWGRETQLTFRARLRVCVKEQRSQYCSDYGFTGYQCQAGCTEDVAASACDPSKAECLAAFLLWASTYLISVFIVFIGLAFFLFSSTLLKNQSRQKVFGKRAKMFLYTLGFFIFLLWVATSVTCASMQVSSIVFSFAVIGIAMLVGIVVGVIGPDEITGKMTANNALKSFRRMAASDGGKGFAILVLSPVIPLFLMLSVVNQAVRRVFFHQDPAASGGGAGAALGFPSSLFTDRYRAFLLKASKWNWTVILSWVTKWSLAYFVLQVGAGICVTLFLAWLNIKLAGLNVFLISFLILVIGLFLFAIPVVPGVPAYVACGVLIASAGERQFNSFALACLLAIFVAALCKQLACVLQQKVFGEMMGKSVKIRSMVGINSETIKAIKVILAKKGMSVGKVMLLVGGPDWPTSVLTGILHCSVVEMQIGTLPIIVPIAFTVMTGAGMYKAAADPNGIWPSLNTIFLLLASIGLMGTGVGFMLYLADFIDAHREEIESIPDEEDVKEYDTQMQEVKDQIARLSQWERLSIMSKSILLISAVLGIVSFWIFSIDSSGCFESPLGWIALGIQVVSFLLLLLHGSLVKHQVKTLSTLGAAEDKPEGNGGPALPMQWEAALASANHSSTMQMSMTSQSANGHGAGGGGSSQPLVVSSPVVLGGPHGQPLLSFHNPPGALGGGLLPHSVSLPLPPPTASSASQPPRQGSTLV
ncbi:hypothetical protein GUITHDRAFT_144035 [Guillardia theta CCMP2712]|uniref:Uncharacterized protein n=1 Tax=Guillardia theta (strain CCMP2712) TaxID=905079 RepID=L1IQV4_GUITC|nr:hypothetical protein GUITHDRAFT_144035 [Guillardia theta CCMP2712]EKX38638.1 hypothetical protein GUITHDRAFT_144035 [Guillardia theta CCMP2712]|eukprot:XP_005825618.1 hypothetical protein GUITHDRAFT_144035 [Guillardia theta CCMP2712]